MLALDDDHTEFRGGSGATSCSDRRACARRLRPLRRATVAHALLRPLCGQLIIRPCATGRALDPPAAGTAAPTAADLARLSPARAPGARARDVPGVHARPTAAGPLDLERLREVPDAGRARRLGRERGIGPWSVGVVCLEGLGRYDHGLVGDLGLVKLLSALAGRWVEATETAELLAPYGEWQGLAGVYLHARLAPRARPGRRPGRLPVPRAPRRTRGLTA